MRLYLRIGDWNRNTEFPSSNNYATGESEVGLSCYDLDEDGNPVTPEIGEWAWEDMVDRLRSDEPKYLVTGDLRGEGGDGEPLLERPREVGRWPEDWPEVSAALAESQRKP